jgi:2,3-bisphosphoglycerate-independent phosphoglycerate mutase
MTEYDPELGVLVAFPPERAHTCLAAEVSKARLKQTHIAETEKYAHATYFLNGGREEPFNHEEHVLIESRKDVATHDLAPEMRAKEITDAALKAIDSQIPFIFINYANADMVGHTAHFEATVKAVETIDTQLARLVPAVTAKGGAVFITADHGNAEIAYNEEENVKHTAHTTNPVPAILTVPGAKLHDGSLADVAPTILSLLNLPIPKTMTGKSLIA